MKYKDFSFSIKKQANFPSFRFSKQAKIRLNSFKGAYVPIGTQGDFKKLSSIILFSIPKLV